MELVVESFAYSPAVSFDVETVLSPERENGLTEVLTIFSAEMKKIAATGN